MKPQYRFGFILTTNLGNVTRFNTLKQFAERDDEVECVWAPVDYRPLPSRAVRMARRLPDALYWRWVALHQAGPVLEQLGRLDAVMVHQFESSMLLSARRKFLSRPRLVSSTDDTPLIRPVGHPMYPNELKRPPALQRLRLGLDLWRARRADLSIPLSDWAAGILTELCGVPRERVQAVSVGIDLSLWEPLPPPTRRAGERYNVLFVGGDFERKGGALLLDVHRRLFADRVDLHIVSTAAPAEVHRNVHVHRNISAGDLTLKRLYADCDVFVLPTSSDLSPWACLEAMASARPVISTRVGGIPDMIEHGVNGLLVESGDGAALAEALNNLLGDMGRRQAMGVMGRRRVEENFDAARNVPKILELMKGLVRPGQPRRNESAATAGLPASKAVHGP